jgi:hypothetical protein
MRYRDPSVRTGAHPVVAVVRALLICSDDECTAVYEAHGRLEEIEALACSCGCGLAVVGWPEPAEAGELELTVLAA